MLFNDLQIGHVYKFSTRSSAFLQTKINWAKLKSKCDISLARRLVPIDQTYAQIFPSLPPGTVYDIAGQTYYVFEQLNGAELVMAGQWIVEATLEEIIHVSYVVDIPNASEGDKDKIARALRAVGISDFSITNK